MVEIILPVSLIILSWDNTNLQNISLQNFLGALEAGIVEEIVVRYVMFSNVFRKLENQKNSLFTSILVSALIFGCLHFMNLTQQSIFPTIDQVIFATAFGIVFAIIYLYFGQIWWVIFIHFFWDWEQTASSISTIDAGVSFDPVAFGGRLIFLAIMIFILWFMMYGKRRKVLRSHADDLIQN